MTAKRDRKTVATKSLETIAKTPTENAVGALNGLRPRGRGHMRDQNPTFGQVEALLTHLEGSAGALVFASGMVASTAAFMVLRLGGLSHRANRGRRPVARSRLQRDG